jgi:predicted metallopeptidase
MKTELATDIDKRLKAIILALNLQHVSGKHVIGMRSQGSKSRAIARIWGLPRIWQQALYLKPYYLIEVVSERFDRMSKEDQDRTLIHELMHVPKTFSGGLVPHECFGKKIDEKSVSVLYKKYLEVIEENPHLLI